MSAYPHNAGQSIFLRDITLAPNSNSYSNSNSNSNSNSKSKEQQEVEVEDHHHHLPLSLFYFPSPFEDDDVLSFQQHQYLNLLSPHDAQFPPLAMREATFGAETTALLADDDHQSRVKMVDWDSNSHRDKTKSADDHRHEEQIPRRRSSKRDRHSKINTARGPRDRRMRLSLEVARKFFGLQDALGFDKASKTVEWLIGKAESEIKKLARDQLNILVSCSDKRSTTSPATSESGEVVSGIDEVVVPSAVNDGEELRSSTKDERKLGGKKLLRKRTFRPLAKASREKARARARERTLRERISRGLEKPCEEESGVTQGHNNSANYTATTTTTTTTHHDSISILEQAYNHEDDHRDYDPLVIMGKWSPSTILTSLQQNTGIISQEHNQFADFQFYGKQPWEVYNNNHNLF